jgi:c-di-GMP phosphodiesterase
MRFASSAGERADQLSLVRQPVLDARMQIIGYRIACAPAIGADDGDPEPALDVAVEAIRCRQLVGASVAHIPLSRELLLTVGIPPLPPEEVVFRIRHDDAMAPELWPTLRTAVARGYDLELDALPGPHFNRGLLEIFGTVEFDLRRWSRGELAVVLAHLRERRLIALAAGVADHEQHAACRMLGFDWFTGSFHVTPDVLAGPRVPAADIETLLRLAARAHGEVRVGARGLARWTLRVAALGAAPQIARELALIALTRARICRELALTLPGLAAEEMFTVGLLSMADALLGIPLEAVVRELPLAPWVSDALLRRTGAAGAALDAVLAYERGQFRIPGLDRELSVCAAAYGPSLAWASGAVAALA